MDKIDLTAIVGSQILCEFWSDYQEFKQTEFKQTGFLCGLDRHGFKAEGCDDIWHENCRIHTNSWTSNADRNVIIPNGLKCIAMYVSFEGERYVLHGETKRGQFFVDGKSEARNQLVCSEHIKVIGPAEGWSYA